jgi:DNA gyrase subunit B
LNVWRARFDKTISSQEIRLLITALGTGIGEEDKSIEKLRYHTVIIMTDADVDGSHIRTLLLTFFYRHFYELIENGHIYIAQPPLFRLKKGKKEHYLKDEAALAEYLVDVGVENVTVKSAKSAKTVSGAALKGALQKLGEVENILSVFERKRRHRVVMSFVAEDTSITPELLSEPEKLREAMKNLDTRIHENAPDLLPVSIRYVEDSEHGGEKVYVSCRLNGSAIETCIDRETLELPEFAVLRGMLGDLSILGEAPFVIESGETETAAGSVAEVHSLIMEAARKGMDIQRYKGLGEMNPEQLWETTMDPEARTLLQVRIEDGVAAEDIFSTLMGDEVEGRRRFIEDNALNVRNLDV